MDCMKVTKELKDHTHSILWTNLRKKQRKGSMRQALPLKERTIVQVKVPTFDSPVSSSKYHVDLKCIWETEELSLDPWWTLHSPMLTFPTCPLLSLSYSPILQQSSRRLSALSFCIWQIQPILKCFWLALQLAVWLIPFIRLHAALWVQVQANPVLHLCSRSNYQPCFPTSLEVSSSTTKRAVSINQIGLLTFL